MFVLLDLVRARLAMVVAISGWRAARQPENAAYLMRNNAVSWARLVACADLQAEQVQAAIEAAAATRTRIMPETSTADMRARLPPVLRRAVSPHARAGRLAV